MKLTILGCGTCAIDLEHKQSGYLLEADDKKYLFDSGPGVMYRLLEIGVFPFDFDHMFYTHTHNDHINDLPAIIWSNQYKHKRKKPMHVYGPTGFKEYMETLVEKIMGKDFLKFPIEVSEVTNKTFAVDNLKITTKELDHYNNIAYRVEHNGKVIVYTGDTEYTDSLMEICKGADLVIMECGQPDTDSEIVHMTPSKCAKVASQANIKKMVLVHLYPQLSPSTALSEARKGFEGEVVVGQDLMEFVV